MGTVVAPAVGDLLAASRTGRFTNNPTSYTYQWSRCDASGNNGIDINGATSARYVTTTADAGHTLRVVVTAIGTGAAQTKSSAHTGVVSGANVNTAAPPAGGFFPMTAGPPSGDFPVPVGTALSALPNDSQAAAMVTRSTWEPRPHNAIQNDLDPIVPETGLAFVTPGFQGVPRTIWDRVTGLCPLSRPRTTDELIQWAAAKWGLSDDFVRAQGQTESYWFQGEVDVDLGFPIIGAGFSATGPAPPPHPGFSDDCQFNRSLGGAVFDPFTTATLQNGPDSFSLVQTKYSAFRPNPPGTGLGSFPWIQLSTAYALDFYCASIRAQYMGLNDWARQIDSSYAAYITALAGGGQGDPWRTARNWFSGLWDDTANIAAGGVAYLTNLEAIYAAKDWLNTQNGAFTATSPERLWIIGDWAPVCFTDPVVSGTPQVGFPFSGSHGSWVSWPRPTSYVYQWQRQVSGVWGDISGATAVPYTPVAADVGNALRVGVAAVNRAGTGTYTYSNASAATTTPLAPPTPATPPVIS